MKKVITYGSFDLLHEGHYNLLKRAKELGDYLIVGVTTEQYDLYRGKMNVAESLMERIENVRRTGLVDEILIEEKEGQKVADIQKYGVDVFAIGSDWLGKFDHLREYCQVVYLERTKDISSTMLRNQRRGVVRLGMVGAGRVAGRFVSEVKYVSGIALQGVCTSRTESAAAFAERHQLGFSTDSFPYLLERVDAVYIASPHETHYDYAKKALLAGKHVLCEKPMVLREDHAAELFELARERGLILLEAVKTAYTPGFLELLSIAKSGRIGAIRDVEAAFTKLVPDGAGQREYVTEAGGSFTELGSYALLPILKLLGRDYRDLRFESIRDDRGNDLYTKAYFRYDDALATAKAGLGVKSEGQLLISGTQGYILVESPWWLTKSFEVCFEDRNLNERFFSKFLGYGLRYEIAEFVRHIGDPGSNNYKLSADDSIAMAAVVERFLLEQHSLARAPRR